MGVDVRVWVLVGEDGDEEKKKGGRGGNIDSGLPTTSISNVRNIHFLVESLAQLIFDHDVLTGPPLIDQRHLGAEFIVDHTAPQPSACPP